MALWMRAVSKLFSAEAGKSPFADCSCAVSTAQELGKTGSVTVRESCARPMDTAVKRKIATKPMRSNVRLTDVLSSLLFEEKTNEATTRLIPRQDDDGDFLIVMAREPGIRIRREAISFAQASQFWKIKR